MHAPMFMKTAPMGARSSTSNSHKRVGYRARSLPAPISYHCNAVCPMGAEPLLLPLLPEVHACWLDARRSMSCTACKCRKNPANKTSEDIIGNSSKSLTQTRCYLQEDCCAGALGFNVTEANAPFMCWGASKRVNFGRTGSGEFPCSSL